jgi:hypothetical protein
VTQADATSIRISITGLNNLPSADVVAGQGLVLAVTPEEGLEEEITVAGQGERGYRVPNARVQQLEQIRRFGTFLNRFRLCRRKFCAIEM